MERPRVRVLVGEGQPARRGLFRFVLENEGFEVVGEAASTMELAQQLAVHRPDVVVLDDGIDATAVAMLREVQPGAKLILVWPRGVAAVGADARLEPAEVMHALAPTVARVAAGSGTVLTAPTERPRVQVPDVIVVPEPEPPGSPPITAGEPPTAAPPAHEPPTELPGSEPAPAAPPATVFPPAVRGPEAPRWTYTAPDAPASHARRRHALRTAAVAAAIAFVGFLALAALLLSLAQPRTVRIQSLVGDVGDVRFPPLPEGTFIEPGTYEGIVDVEARGSIRMRASGTIALRLEGNARVEARGDVEVSGKGVVRTSNDHRTVRVTGSGIVRLTVDGSVRIRLDGSISGRTDGTLRIDGEGTFLIHRAPS
jgi:CheY-like chemotaxis protein